MCPNMEIMIIGYCRATAFVFQHPQDMIIAVLTVLARAVSDMHAYGHLVVFVIFETYKFVVAELPCVSFNIFLQKTSINVLVLTK